MPHKRNHAALHRDVSLYHRHLKIADYFSSKTHDHVPFTFPSTWEPAWSSLSRPVKILLTRDTEIFHQFSADPDRRDNLLKLEREALKRLLDNQNIIVKPADKGSKIVLIDKQQYAFEAYRQLNNIQYYKRINNTIHTTTSEKTVEVISFLYQHKFISAKQRNFRCGPDNPRHRLFDLLPKIHKEPTTWTLPACDSTTYNIAQYIDHFLGPLSSLHPSYIKDTFNFLDIIRPIVVLSSSFLFTIDIDSLYTNINTNMGLSAVREVFLRHPDLNRSLDVYPEVRHSVWARESSTSQPGAGPGFQM